MYEIYKTRKFRSERIPNLHGLHGIWRCAERTAFMDAGRVTAYNVI